MSDLRSWTESKLRTALGALEVASVVLWLVEDPSRRVEALDIAHGSPDEASAAAALKQRFEPQLRERETLGLPIGPGAVTVDQISWVDLARELRKVGRT